MKTHHRYPTKKLIWIGAVGFICAVFFLLAPLHEAWHAVFSLLHGHIPEVSWTGVYSGDRSISMSLAGPFGELISFGAIFVFAIRKKKIYLAAFMAGYMAYNVIILSIPGYTPTDFQIAMGYGNQDWYVKFMHVMCVILNYLWEITAIAAIYQLRKKLERKSSV